MDRKLLMAAVREPLLSQGGGQSSPCLVARAFAAAFMHWRLRCSKRVSVCSVRHSMLCGEAKYAPARLTELQISHTSHVGDLQGVGAAVQKVRSFYALSAAASAGRADLVERILQRGLGFTPVQLGFALVSAARSQAATAESAVAVVQLLLSAGAPVGRAEEVMVAASPHREQLQALLAARAAGA